MGQHGFGRVLEKKPLVKNFSHLPKFGNSEAWNVGTSWYAHAIFLKFCRISFKKIHWVKNSPTIWSILSKLGLLRICFEVWRILAYIRPNFVISWKFTRGIFASIWPGEWKSGFQDQCGIFVGLAGLAISLECRGCIESMGVHFWGEAEALGIN